MILFENLSVTYPGEYRPALAHVDVKIGEGELALVIGPTGAGKSTLLRSVNGLVPHFSGGRITGRVSVEGRSTADHRPRDLADVVGFVGQDPDATFVADIVEDELAYSMENLGLPAPTMRRRVEDVLDTLNLHSLRQRPIMSLSGGQRQRVAIGAVLTAAPRLLVLDEPTSSLDPLSAEEVLAALSRLVHDQGVTILVAEHRLERIVHAADLIVYVPATGSGVRVGLPTEILATSVVAPPIVRLAQTAGWDLLPLSVRDARRLAPGLRERLPAGPDHRHGPAPTKGPPVATVRRLSARFGKLLALDDVDLDLFAGEVTAIMGRNGAGKSTLLRHLVGLRPPQQGTVIVAGRKPSSLRPTEATGVVGLVPQDPASLLSADTVAAECADADGDAKLPAGSTRAALERLMPELGDTVHPRDLSEGQRLCLALAIVLAPKPPLILLDEPTRGLDYTAKARLTTIVRGLAAEGHCVVIATHDVGVGGRHGRPRGGPGRRGAHQRRAHPGGRLPLARPRSPGGPHPGPGPVADGGRGRIGAGPVTTSRALKVTTIGKRGGFAIAVASLVGLAAFTWPLFTHPAAQHNQAHAGDAPWIMAVIIPLLLVALLGEVGTGGIDAKGVALLGVLGACGAALRIPSSGTAGFEPTFFLLFPAGYVLGRHFGFLLGALTLFASALVTGGVGPWLPFQMMAAAWIGYGAGLVPRRQGRLEVTILASYAAVACLVYGLLTNLWFWPFGAGTTTAFSFQPGASLGHNLIRFLGFDVTTSLGFDIPTAVVNAALVLTVGRPVIAALRRASHRAAFGAAVELPVPGVDDGALELASGEDG